MKLYLAGQHNFGNRGCEALVRSVMGIVQERLPEARFLVPTLDEVRDNAQWPEIAAHGGEFVPAISMPAVLKWWNRLVTRAPAALPMWEPRYQPRADVASALSASAGVLMIGGDCISLDYGLGSLFQWSGLLDAAHRAGRPTMLFAASVGPFGAQPSVEKFMVAHLRRYSAVSVRETESLGYLQRLGLDNAVLVADPAFRLKPQAVELGPPFDSPSDGVLAFNISPLVEPGWLAANPNGSLIGECVAFLRRVLDGTRLNIALLPHVDPLDGSRTNSDSSFMSGLLAELGGAAPRLALVRRGLNAAQTKYLIGASRYLVAARTHATVGGWSQHVPTISIAYSVKALGLNKDLFDSLDYVLSSPQVSRETLWASMQLLIHREPAIRAHLAERMPLWRQHAGKSGDLLMDILR